MPQLEITVDTDEQASVSLPEDVSGDELAELTALAIVVSLDLVRRAWQSAGASDRQTEQKVDDAMARAVTRWRRGGIEMKDGKIETRSH